MPIITAGAAHFLLTDGRGLMSYPKFVIMLPEPTQDFSEHGYSFFHISLTPKATNPIPTNPTKVSKTTQISIITSQTDRNIHKERIEDLCTGVNAVQPQAVGLALGIETFLATDLAGLVRVPDDRTFEATANRTRTIRLEPLIHHVPYRDPFSGPD